MENQHRKINGYRELNQREIDLMNQIKEKGEELKQLLFEVDIARAEALHDIAEERDAMQFNDESLKWQGQAEMSLRTGIMQLIRAVAVPHGF